MQLYLRGGIYYCWVRGKRHSTKCRDYKAAQIAAREIERKEAAPTSLSSKTSLRSALETFLVEREQAGKSLATLDMYRYCAGHVLRVFGEKATLSDITRESLLKFVETRLNEKASRNTIHKNLITIRQTLDIAYQSDLYDRDPRKVMPKFAVKYEPKTRFLTQEEAEKFLPQIYPAHRSQVLFMIATGARLGESRRAELADIDLAEGVVSIRGTKTKKSARRIPLVGHMRALLETIVKDPLLSKSGPMFPHWHSPHRDMLAAAERADIPPVSANGLRKSFATWLNVAGLDPATIGLRTLGHTTSRMAEQVYVQPSSGLRALMEHKLATPQGRALLKAAKRLAGAVGDRVLRAPRRASGELDRTDTAHPLRLPPAAPHDDTILH